MLNCSFSFESSVSQDSSSSEFSYSKTFPVAPSNAEIRNDSEIYDRKYLLSSNIRYREDNSRDTDSELWYDTDIELTHLSSSDVHTCM